MRRADGPAVVVDVRADECIAPRDGGAFEVTRRACADPVRHIAGACSGAIQLISLAAEPGPPAPLDQ